MVGDPDPASGQDITVVYFRVTVVLGIQGQQWAMSFILEGDWNLDHNANLNGF